MRIPNLILHGTGKRYVTSAGSLAAAAALLFCLCGSVAAEELDSFLLPGVDIRSADLEVGGWCRYLVVDEAEGVRDSVFVYAAVVGREEGDSGESYWLEFASAPAGTGPEDLDVTRLLLSSTITDLARGDSLYHYVREMYVRRGTEPPHAADPRDLKRLTLTDPTSDDDWKRSADEKVTTALGVIACERKELLVEESREVPTGRVKIVQRKRDHFIVWSSPRVPLFGLVRCVIEREHDSKTIPRLPGIPESGPRTSRVTTEVVAWGDGALPLIPLP